MREGYSGMVREMFSNKNISIEAAHFIYCNYSDSSKALCLYIQDFTLSTVCFQ